MREQARKAASGGPAKQPDSGGPDEAPASSALQQTRDQAALLLEHYVGSAAEMRLGLSQLLCDGARERVLAGWDDAAAIADAFDRVEQEVHAQLSSTCFIRFKRVRWVVAAARSASGLTHGRLGTHRARSLSSMKLPFTSAERRSAATQPPDSLSSTHGGVRARWKAPFKWLRERWTGNCADALCSSAGQPGVPLTRVVGRRAGKLVPRTFVFDLANSVSTRGCDR